MVVQLAVRRLTARWTSGSCIRGKGSGIAQLTSSLQKMYDVAGQSEVNGANNKSVVDKLEGPC